MSRGPDTWLVTGAAGMLGQEIVARLARAGQHVVPADHGSLDVTDPASVRAVLDTHRPAAVVNCAAWTDVDDAEYREPAALAVNGNGPALLAACCRRHGSLLLHVSTDYVFHGDGDRPYTETDAPAPCTAYGRTKLAGEQAVVAELPDAGFVVRTAWLYGARGGNFVRTVIRLERTRPTLDVVDDQRGQPTWTADVADRLVALGTTALAGDAPPGVYHATADGDATWHRLAIEVFRLLGADQDRVRPTTSAAFPRPAPRPAYSVLGQGRWQEAGLPPLRHWRAALTEAFPALRAAEREDPDHLSRSTTPAA